MSDDAQSISALGLAINLRAEPWRYPGPFLPFSCVQLGDRLLPLRAGDADLLGQLRQHAGTSSTVLHFVIAIGSNASPDVIRRKFERRGVSTTVLHAVGQLNGFALGYSAHVSPAGYMPVAPYPDARSSARIVVSALTEQQLECLDDTEPNYQRVTMRSDSVHLQLPVTLPPQVHIYQSRWGIIVDSTGTPIPFGTQDAIVGRLAEWNLLPPSIAMARGPEHVSRMLGEHDELRTTIREHLTQYARKRHIPNQRSATAP